MSWCAPKSKPSLTGRTFPEHWQASPASAPSTKPTPELEVRQACRETRMSRILTRRRRKRKTKRRRRKRETRLLKRRVPLLQERAQRVQARMIRRAMAKAHALHHAPLAPQQRRQRCHACSMQRALVSTQTAATFMTTTIFGRPRRHQRRVREQARPLADVLRLFQQLLTHFLHSRQ